MVQAQTFKPEAVKLTTGPVGSNWSYADSVKTVRGHYISWKTVSNEMLAELWVAKQAITKGGKRKSGVPKNGEKSWSMFVKECFGEAISKRTIDSYLKQYVRNGNQKPVVVKKTAVSDHSKLVIHSAVQVDNRIKLDIYLPEHETNYIQYIAA